MKDILLGQKPNKPAEVKQPAKKPIVSNKGLSITKGDGPAFTPFELPDEHLLALYRILASIIRDRKLSLTCGPSAKHLPPRFVSAAKPDSTVIPERSPTPVLSLPLKSSATASEFECEHPSLKGLCGSDPATLSKAPKAGGMFSGLNPPTPNNPGLNNNCSFTFGGSTSPSMTRQVAHIERLKAGTKNRTRNGRQFSRRLPGRISWHFWALLASCILWLLMVNGAQISYRLRQFAGSLKQYWKNGLHGYSNFLGKYAQSFILWLDRYQEENIGGQALT
jgi:hypothetical protein